jgi:phosphoheptose isomerase
VKDLAKRYLMETGDALYECVRDPEFVRAVDAAVDEICATFTRAGKLFICGNGGSAAMADHMATEFMSIISQPAIALTTSSAFLTGYSNDVNYDGAFTAQLRTLGTPKDTLLAISTSGRSESVLRAVKAARTESIKVIALTSFSADELMEFSDISIPVVINTPAHCQDIHMAVLHSIFNAVRARFDN